MEEGDTALKATDVFVGFLLLDQLREAALHDAGRPLVDQSLAVVVTPDNALDALRHSRKHKKQHTQSHVGVTGCCFTPRGSEKKQDHTVLHQSGASR